MNSRILTLTFYFLAFFMILTGTISAQARRQSSASKAPAATSVESQDYEAMRREAEQLIAQNKYINALPLLEKLAAKYPGDAEVIASYGIALLANAVTMNDEALRKATATKAGVILLKAKQLGTKNNIALHYADMVKQGRELDVTPASSENKEVVEAIREGEGYFSRGEFAKARESYERAYKLDPNSYEAVLYIADCYYSERRYAESEPWFAKAVSLNPNGEQGHRFWGDALMMQGKKKEALDKFADAVIADPSSRLAWTQLLNWVKENGNRDTAPVIRIPGEREEDPPGFNIKPEFLKIEDGTINWKKYNETRKKQAARSGGNVDSNNEPSLADEVEALKSVVAGIRSDKASGKIKGLDDGLRALIELDESDLLDVYVLMFVHNASNCYEFDGFRENARDKMRRFFVEYIAMVKF